MQHRRLGRTNLQVSVVGFGTCQLRMVPETQAIDTLLRGFELGVNLIHTAPDYEGAEDLVAKAIARTPKQVIVASQGYDIHFNSDGQVHHFEKLFEDTCKRFRTDRLDLYGIACVDDREAYRENVWGKGGMVEFLQKKKAQGRLGGIFCTTHGNPEFIAKLVNSGVFDAIMMAYNELGFHLLSYSPPPGRHFENLQRNKLEIFPLCRQHDVGIMIMKPLAGGLLSRGKAFPPLHDDSNLQRPTATEVLRSILKNAEVACVVPGTASVPEADENARAGHEEPVAHPGSQLRALIGNLQSNLCSRCGICDTQCSQKLRVSWLHRAAYVALHPSETFETWKEVEYFRLHPGEQAVCNSCADITCSCPIGIDIPRNLSNLHSKMIALRERGLAAPAPSAGRQDVGSEEFRASLVLRTIPEKVSAGSSFAVRLFVENTGTRSWFSPNSEHQGKVCLDATLGKARPVRVFTRHDVHPGERCHFVLNLEAGHWTRRSPLRLRLLSEHDRYSPKAGLLLFDGAIEFDTNPKRERGISAAGPSLTLRASVANFIMALANKPHQSFLARTVKAARALPGIVKSVLTQRRKDDYAVEWLEHNLPEEWPEGSTFHAFVRFANRGNRTWLACHPAGKNVDLTASVDGGPPQGCRLTRNVAPGEEITLTVPLALKGGDGPSWEVKIALVEQQVAWFEEMGALPLMASIRKAAPRTGPTAAALAVAQRANNWGYQPTQGLAFSRDGRAYPMFIREARGCRIRDLEGREWIDFVMGWGAALLGYAHPDVQAAVEPYLNSGAVLSLPHGLEMQLTDVLCQRFPGAETVLFGKNGSDVCTAAVRMARVYTGRRKILFSGYHGWQDWYAECSSPELAPTTKTSFRFRCNDFDDFLQQVKRHRGEIAAVVLEPAAQVEGIDGPVRNADPDFLSRVAGVCREQSMVLVFDEIMTGFRNKGGSVQHETGIVPDLTCLGKALTSGWPLSALLGRGQIMESTISRIYYHPTFKGEAYSFAAALAALEVYKTQDVSAAIHSFGRRLMEGITCLSKELGVAGRMVGLPYRMVYSFTEPDISKLAIKRTLLIQELMKQGVLTFRGFMLPSLAHGEEELALTLQAFRHALEVVKRAEAGGSFVRHLEIPLVG